MLYWNPSFQTLGGQMKVLVVGSGGREHAICYKLNQSADVEKIYAIPGNPGIAQLATCVAGSVEDIDAIVSFVKENAIDLTVVGPEVPLCLGLVDAIEDAGYLAFGPKKAAAALEGSKAFSKDFMVRHGIKTAKYVEVDTIEEAKAALAGFCYPVVIKADGLAAGKGVIICEDEKMANEALEDLMVTKTLSDAGDKVVIEEFLKGFECSLLCFVDNDTILPMVSVKDHKQIGEGNTGLNTGGMGTVSPNPFLPAAIEARFEQEILDKFMAGIKADNLDYRGIVFIGLMIDGEEINVLEFNVRFGDPETQSILLRLESDLAQVMKACATNTLATQKLVWSDKTAVTLVLSAPGYPGNYPKGSKISNLDQCECVVFHAGTKEVDGDIVTNGGRVLNICALGDDLEDARAKVYKDAQVIHFDGMYYRKDIGLI